MPLLFCHPAIINDFHSFSWFLFIVFATVSSYSSTMVIHVNRLNHITLRKSPLLTLFFFFFYPYQSEGSRCFHVRIVKYHETLLTRQIIKYRRTISKIIKNYCTISTSFFPRSIPLSLQCSYSVMNVLHSTVKLLTIVLIQIASHPTKS